MARHTALAAALLLLAACHVDDRATVGDAVGELRGAWCGDPRGTLPDGSCDTTANTP